MSSKTGARKVLTPKAFAAVLKTAEMKTTAASKWQEAHAILHAFEKLSNNRGFNTPAHFDAALKLAGGPLMEGTKFHSLTTVANECFKAGAAVTPKHFNEFFAELEKTYDAAEKHGIPYSEYSAMTAHKGVFVSLAEAFATARQRLDQRQAKDFIALTTAAIEAGASLSDVSELLANSAIAFKTQSPAQITKTIELLKQTAAQHGGAAAGETANRMVFYPVKHDVHLRITEKALQNKLKPHRALEAYGQALRESAARAADVEEGIEGGVLLGPEGRSRLNQAVFSRKLFLAKARNTAAELGNRKPRDAFERELRNLHY